MDELASGSRLGGMAWINDLGNFLTIAAAPERDGSKREQTGAKAGAPVHRIAEGKGECGQ